MGKKKPNFFPTPPHNKAGILEKESSCLPSIICFAAILTLNTCILNGTKLNRLFTSSVINSIDMPGISLIELINFFVSQGTFAFGFLVILSQVCSMDNVLI